LAQILLSKFADHRASYRQSPIYARHADELDRSTMAHKAGPYKGKLIEPGQA
jgi:transposase